MQPPGAQSQPWRKAALPRDLMQSSWLHLAFHTSDSKLWMQDYPHSTPKEYKSQCYYYLQELTCKRC